MKLEEFFRYLLGELRLVGVESSELEAEWIIEHLTHIAAIERIKRPDRQIDNATVEQALQIVERRGRGDPLAYILGEKDFFGLKFLVTPDVLIPRPETEHLVEHALEWIQDHFVKGAPVELLEFGVGSGCISVSLLHLLPELKATAIEISPAAIKVAETNAVRLKVNDRLTLIQGDAANAISLVNGKTFDLLLSNPPYISPEDRNLQKSVRDFEPHIALFSPNGTDIMASWISLSAQILKTPSAVGFEIGRTQAAAAKQIFDDCQFFQSHDILQDYSGHDRIIWAERKGN